MFTRKLIFGDVGFTGRIAPSTLQYSGTKSCGRSVFPVPGFNVADTMVAPLVGNPMAEAGIIFPARLEHSTLGLILGNELFFGLAPAGLAETPAMVKNATVP